MALFWRGISGEGHHIDVSIIESVLRTALFQYVDWFELPKIEAPIPVSDERRHSHETDI